jgi:hypothetical protein
MNKNQNYLKLIFDLALKLFYSIFIYLLGRLTFLSTYFTFYSHKKNNLISIGQFIIHSKYQNSYLNLFLKYYLKCSKNLFVDVVVSVIGYLNF